MNKKFNIHNGKWSLKALIITLLAAASLALLIIQVAWKFELRSTTKWLLQGGLLAIPLWLSFYFSPVRERINTLQVEIWQFVIAVCISILLATQFVPLQLTMVRTLVAKLMVTGLFFILVITLINTIFSLLPIKGGEIFRWVLLLVGLVGIVLLLRNTLFARIYADDFCYAVDYDSMGFPKAGLFFYRDWSGRFFSNFLVMGLADQHRTIKYLLLLTILVNSAAFYTLTESQGLNKWISALTGGTFLTLAISLAAPDFYKSLFWTGSALVLFPIFILIPVYLLVIHRLLKTQKKPTIWWIILTAILSFVITTTHEVAALGWILMNGAVLVWSIFAKPRRKRIIHNFTPGLIAALIGLTVMLIAPGIDNRARVQHYPGAASLFQTINISFQNYLTFFYNLSTPYYAFEQSGRAAWLLIAGALAFGWVLETPFKRNWLTVFFVFVTTLMMVLTCFIPGAYVYHGNIPLRSQMIPTYYLLMGAVICGMALPKPNSKMIENNLFLLAIIAVLLAARLFILQQLEIAEPLHQYAQDWDSRDTEYRTSIGIPPRISIPWDAYEQNIDCVELFYGYE